MKLGEMRWPEIRDLDKSGVVAVFPIASFEQHGHHLPLLTDTLETQGIVDRLDRLIGGKIACLPTQWLGYSFHHMRFSGSLTATSSTHIRLLVETVDGLVQAGFERILIVNGHGGNLADIRVAQQDLKALHADARVWSTSWWLLAAPELDAIKEAGPSGSGHAGEMETSLMLALHPNLVRTDKLQRDGFAPPSEYRDRVTRMLRTDEQSERGNYGDPTVASAEKGERMLAVILEALVQVVNDILDERL
jgi:creatinine amidohydrolase